MSDGSRADANYPSYDSVLRDSKLVLCPATGVNHDIPDPHDVHRACNNGKTLLSWCFTWGNASSWSDLPAHGFSASSYGQNGCVPYLCEQNEHIWASCLVKGADRVPIYFDCRAWVTNPSPQDCPPPCADAGDCTQYRMDACAIDRHTGGINSLFLDWSVRKVGIKELWTLKWSPDYNAAGPWTKRGGVKPEDWPAWMRGFKDY
jgi:prepilin-type processing-associated H-X9-DG protein